MREKREFLIKYLLDERRANVRIPTDEREQMTLLRGLMNVREAKPIGEDFLRVQDEYLRSRAIEKGIVDESEIAPMRGKMCLWHGDISRLKVGAIVNACNSGLTGCYQPNHSCIDNVIHTYAGVQLRLICDEITNGVPEPSGRARITPAYNLPSDYVLHTVGPICQGTVTDSQRKTLASCYSSCLRLAAENGVETVAFCCISTGVYGFPQKDAAEIAVSTVEKELQALPQIRKVIFDVFSARDEGYYTDILTR